jgi:hypothetical protein
MQKTIKVSKACPEGKIIIRINDFSIECKRIDVQ